MLSASFIALSAHYTSPDRFMFFGFGIKRSNDFKLVLEVNVVIDPKRGKGKDSTCSCHYGQKYNGDLI